MTPRSLVIVNAGTSDPSSSRMLADRIAQHALDGLAEQGAAATLRVIELGPLAGEIAHAIVSGTPTGDLAQAVDALARADGVIVATPVYKAGISGLLKSFVDVLDNDLLIAKPVVLAGTAGSERHALVIDDQLRALLAFMRTLTAPTSVFAAPSDWSDAALGRRIRRAAGELAALVASGVGPQIAGANWGAYQHAWGSAARGAEREDGGGAGFSLDFDSDMMRLAAGGQNRPQDTNPQHPETGGF